MSEKSILACMPSQSKGRLFPEVEALERSCFQRDRDRIIHSTAFRRLEYKTQVFLNHEGDLFRTRLTHSLEVSQIARSLCRSLCLNEELGEAIALAHDLGHTPFGHAGEEALQELYPSFDHNSHGLKLLTKLEQKYARFDGLNLTWETLEGLAKHNGPVENPSLVLKEFNEIFNLDLEKYSSLEAQLSSLADDIAYISHDIDDGLRAGLFELDDLMELPVLAEKITEARNKYPDIAEKRIASEMISPVMTEFVMDVLTYTKLAISELKIESVQDVRDANQPVAKFSDEMAVNLKTIKSWLMNRMYKHENVIEMTDNARQIIRDLYEFYITETNNLPQEWQERLNENNLNEVVADYIAGMTDRFAIEQHNKNFS